MSLSPGSAQAFVVTVGGVQYDVTTFTGSYDDNTSKFETAANRGVMPWWGSATLASEFATQVGSGLGIINNPPGGPAFAYSHSYPFAYTKMSNGTSAFDNSYLQMYPNNNGIPIVWAQAAPLHAAPAPGPLPLFGAGAAFGFSRQLRKRIKLAPGALGSSQPLA
jgi:hypothetical protein